MPYAIDGQISESPIKGGIQITDAEYTAARGAILSGGSVVIRNETLRVLGADDVTIYSTTDRSKSSMKQGDDVPSGYTEKTPNDLDVWDGSDWVIDQDAKDALIGSHIKTYRQEREVGGFSAFEMSFESDEKTERRVVGAWAKAKADPTYSVDKWKVGDIFVSLSNSTLIGIGDAFDAHIQKCFEAESVVEAAHSATPYVSVETVEAAFDAAYNA